MSADEPDLALLERWLAGDLPQHEAALLEQRLETDERLARRLDALQSHQALGDELRAALRGPGAASGTDAISRPELRDHELLGELARGGQGVVYRARQRSTGREVALKLLHAERGGSALDQARFLRECEIVASLSHPHVVKVFERGVSTDGRPFVVMELIDGRPIDLAADALGLDLHARLALFDKLCAAVAYAHRHGVIHRDLKPANVLVDASGEPHVLDFGLAKLPDAEALTGLTAPGEFLGTLAFAAPEQLEGDPAAVDARVDVHALGVILYRLLTGAHPVPTDGSLASVVRHVLGTDPTPPRRVAPGVAALGHRLDEDLDALVLTALARSPGDRYATVEALRDDLRRWHRGEPLAARADRRSYVLRKTLRRHRVLVSAVAVVLVSLTVAVVVTRGALADARRQATRAHVLNTFLVESLTEATPGVAPRDLTVVDGMRQAARDVGTRFADDPHSEGTIRAAIAWVLRESGVYDEAERHAERALALLESTAGPRSREALGVRRTLAELAQERGDTELAEERFARLLADSEGVLAAADVERAALERAVASLRLVQGRADDAVMAMRMLRDRLAAERGPHDLETLATTQLLAMALRLAGEPEEALALWDELLAEYTARFGADNAKALVAGNNRANVLVDLGRLDEAGQAYAEVARHQDAVLGPTHPGTLQTRVSRAALLSRMGRHDEATAAFVEVLEPCRAELGERHVVTLQALHGLGSSARLAGQAASAVGILEQAHAGRSASLGDDHEHTIQSALELAIALRQTGQLARARPLVDDCRARAERILGELDPTTTAALFLSAIVSLDLGEPRAAEQAFAELVRRTRAVEGPDSWRAWRYAGQQAQALLALGEDESARALLEPAWEGLAAALGADSPHARSQAALLASLAARRGDEPARQLWQARATGTAADP